MGNVIILKKYSKRSGGDYFRAIPGYFSITKPEIFEYFREGKTVVMLNCSEERELLSIIKTAEDFSGDIKCLKRIIQNGGFLSYIRHLETKLSKGKVYA